jgi:hypothetical protein
MNPVKRKEAEIAFQSFSLYPETSSVLVSDKLMKEIPIRSNNGSNNRIVQKYLPIDYFIKSLLYRYFYMAAPSSWDDVFEMKYLDVLNSPNNTFPQIYLSKLKDMSIFCTCMTYNDSDNEEASWKSYNTEREKVIRISYDLDKLCTILDKAIDENIYIGLVDYKPRMEILEPTCVDCPIVNETNNDAEVLYVNNFCLKQDAYNYEKELRFCIIKYGDQSKGDKGIRIENVDLSPSITKITLPPINPKHLDSEEFEEKKFQQVKMALTLKAICPNVLVHVSNLYNTSKTVMTSEIELNI